MFFKPIKIAALLFTAAALIGADEDFRNIRTKNTTLPLYHNDKLQAVLFGGDVSRIGRLVHVNNPVIDIVRSDLTNANYVKTGLVAPYPLSENPLPAFNFWKKRIVFSEGVVISSTAEVDQENRQVSGDKAVFFRSPAIDIDGVGYHADYRKRQCLVKSLVKIRIRNLSNLKEIITSGNFPAQVEHIRASSDELFIDLAANEITLTKNVVLERADGIIHCDKMMIYLEKKADGAKDDLIGSGTGVSRVECFGNVRMERGGTPGKASGSNGLIDFSAAAFPAGLWQMERPGSGVIYCAAPKNNLESSGLTVSGTKVNADKFKWDFRKKEIHFAGNVRLRDQQLNLDCGTMKIYMAQLDEKGNMRPAVNPTAKGREVIRKIECVEKVKTSDGGYQLFCDNLTLFFEMKNGKSEPSKGLADGNVHIILEKNKDGKPEVSELFADRGELFIDRNQAVFTGRVKVFDPTFALKSQKLEIYAEPYPPGTVFPPSIPGQAPKRIRLNNRLELKSIVATSDVEISRKSKEPGQDEHAYGELGVYTVKNGEIILSGSDEKPPRVTRGNNSLNVFKGGKIRVDLNTEIAETIDAGAEMAVEREKTGQGK